MKKISLVTAGLLGLMPVLASAQQTIDNFITGTFATFLGNLVPIFITIGVLYFIWGVIMYVIADDEEAKSSGKNRMIWGLIGMFVIVSFWGLINVLQTTLGVQNDSADTIDINPYGPG